MIRTTLATVLIAALAGCSAKLEPVGMGGQGDRSAQQTQLAAYAASDANQYPEDAEASNDFRAAAVVNRESGTIRIFNFSNQPLTNAKLWINQNYVREVDMVPANGSKRISYNELYDPSGRTLSSAKTPVTNVQIQTGDRLHNVMGPAFE
jgi:hypothetical protein